MTALRTQREVTHGEATIFTRGRVPQVLKLSGLMLRALHLTKTQVPKVAPATDTRRHVLSMVDDRPYKAGVVGSSPTVPTKQRSRGAPTVLKI